MRPKPFLTYCILCGIPLFLLAGLNYWNGIRAVDSTVSAIVQNDLNSFNVAIDEELRERKSDFLRFGMMKEVQYLVADKETHSLEVQPQGLFLTLKMLPDLSREFQALILYDQDRHPVWFRNGAAAWTPLENIPFNVAQPDARVWEQHGNVALQKPGSTAATLEYSVPIHDEKGTSNAGAVVGVLDLESVFSAAARGLETRSNQGSMVIALDRSGKIIYHPDRSLRLRSAGEALPGFNPIASAMTNNESGLSQFQTSTGSYIAAYSPIPALNIAVAIGRRRSEPVSNAHRWGITGLVLALLASIAGAFMLERHVQRRSKGIARVTEDVSAIAKGELDRRIILQSSDDARSLADNINVVTERLRAQIAREEESRQFESFVRISAMLTHDLKNAIEGLSLTVGNMERHFDNPQFRTDALKGLTSATDKLKALVARLSRPLTSLSGEHKRPKNVDLVPILQRVIAMTAEPLRSKHKIVMRLPQNLFALVDEARIEEVMENLILNALEAMADRSGTLTIEAGTTATGAPMFLVND